MAKLGPNSTKARHREDIHLIDAYFDAEAFEQELASLPGKYVPPHGQLLLATLERTPAGCVALRENRFRFL
jgi:hypothetical protein